VAAQACYLPTSKDGFPLIGEHPNSRGVYIATGHSCWGILNSPVTGLMLSELIDDGQIACVDSATVAAVDPKGRC
jgi:glycine/D-amino acid oxidase-like deaminating enzyme